MRRRLLQDTLEIGVHQEVGSLQLAERVSQSGLLGLLVTLEVLLHWVLRSLDLAVLVLIHRLAEKVVEFAQVGFEVLVEVEGRHEVVSEWRILRTERALAWWVAVQLSGLICQQVERIPSGLGLVVEGERLLHLHSKRIVRSRDVLVNRVHIRESLVANEVRLVVLQNRGLERLQHPWEGGIGRCKQR